MAPSFSRHRILRLTKEQQRAEAMRELRKIEKKIRDLEDALKQEQTTSLTGTGGLENCDRKGTQTAGRLAMNALFVENRKRSLLASKRRMNKLLVEISACQAKRDRILETVKSTQRALQTLNLMGNKPPKRRQ